MSERHQIELHRQTPGAKPPSKAASTTTEIPRERTGPRGCICRPSARRWLDDGTCATCTQNVLESQITPVVLKILCGGTGLCLWRNARGFDSHFPDGTQRKAPIRYGVGDGGADYLGPWAPTGRFVAVELKTPIGRLQPNQRAFGHLVAKLGGIYAVVRSEQHARELLAYLRGGADRPAFVFAPAATENA